MAAGVVEAGEAVTEDIGEEEKCHQGDAENHCSVIAEGCADVQPQELVKSPLAAASRAFEAGQLQEGATREGERCGVKQRVNCNKNNGGNYRQDKCRRFLLQKYKVLCTQCQAAQ